MRLHSAFGPVFFVSRADGKDFMTTFQNTGFTFSDVDRHGAQALNSRWISLRNMLRVAEETMPSKSAEPSYSYRSYSTCANYWEWDMTTPNTRLWRTGRRG